MKKNIFILLFSLFLISNLSAKKPKIKSFYQHDVFKIDGNIDDWGDMAIYDEKTSIISNLSNDQDYIYIKIRISSYGGVSRFLMSGFTVWFNTEGKQRPQRGLAFPLERDISQQYKDHIKVLKGLSKLQADRLREKYLTEFNHKFSNGLSTIRIIDKNEEDIFYKSSNLNKEGLSAVVNLVDFDLVIYEARIPIEYVLDTKEELLQSSEKSFCIGYEYGKIKVKNRNNQTTSAPIHQRTSSYSRRNRHQVQNYIDIPALTAWYKKVYLSNE